MGLAKHEVILLSTQNGQAVETDLSPDVVSIEVDQEVATDSDPQKITVVLADPEGKYDAGFVPQVDQLRITVFYVKQSPFKATPITDEDGTFKGWEMASSSTEEVFPVFEGYITDTRQNVHQCEVHATDTVGHLSDALTLDYNEKMTTNFESNYDLLLKHEPLIPFTIEGANLDMNERTHKPITTWQDSNEMTRMISGMTVYSEETGKHLVLRDSSLVRYSEPYMQHIYDYVLNCNDANSVMGYHNLVTVIGKPAMSASRGAELEIGSETTRHHVLEYTYPSPGDPLSDGQEGADYTEVTKYGPLVAPVEYSPYLNTREQCRKRAKQLWYFYRTFKNSLTKVDVCAKVPYIHSNVLVVTSSPNLDSISLVGEDSGGYSVTPGGSIDYGAGGDSIPAVGTKAYNLILMREVVKRKQLRYDGRDFVATLTLMDKSQIERQDTPEFYTIGTETGGVLSPMNTEPQESE